MGLVRKQAFYNSVFNYIGQVVGYLNVAILFPIFLTQEEFGLTRLITSLGAVYSQVSSFGVQRIAVRYFPFFRTEDNKHHGFITLLLAMPGLGFLMVTIVFFLTKDTFLIGKQDSQLFDQYYLAVPLVALLTLYYKVFDSYLRALYKTNLTGFLNNVFLKLLWLLSVYSYYKGWIGFDAFILTYFASHAVLILILLVYLIAIGQLHLEVDIYYFRKRVLKRIARYGSFSILDDLSSTMMVNIDKIMIGFMLNLETLAVYTVATYLSTVVAIPSSSLGRILIPMISPLWKQRKHEALKQLYHRSSILNMIFSGGVFVLLWGNIDYFLLFLDEDYRSGVYVILIITLGGMVDLSFGLNGDIILMSKHYVFNTVSAAILVVVAIVLNAVLIPWLGLNGAALATLISQLLYNIVKHRFLVVKEGMQPFTRNSYIVIGIIATGIAISYIIPPMHLHFVLELIIRSIILGVPVFASFYFLKVSPDYSMMIDKSLQKIGILKTTR